MLRTEREILTNLLPERITDEKYTYITFVCIEFCTNIKLCDRIKLLYTQDNIHVYHMIPLNSLHIFFELTLLRYFAQSDLMNMCLMYATATVS